MVVADDEIVLSHKREILSIALWKMTEADSHKLGCRYRSAGVLGIEITPIQHEHVITRESMVTNMIDGGDPGRCAEIMETALGCLVTKAEHERLTKLERSHPDLSGWERYREAAVVVYDTQDAPLDAAGLIDLARATPISFDG